MHERGGFFPTLCGTGSLPFHLGRQATTPHALILSHRILARGSLRTFANEHALSFQPDRTKDLRTHLKPGPAHPPLPSGETQPPTPRISTVRA